MLVSQIKKIRTFIVESELESLLLEANFIKKYSPKYNVKMTDGKNYPLIRIVFDTYPKVLTARKPEDPNSLYFGPYPSTKAMRMVLRVIRRIFPFVSVMNHPKRICLYHHLGLCPCPPVFDTPELKKQYHKTIKHIIDFLEGNTKKVLRDLEKERNEESKFEHFEEAKNIQKKIDAIEYVTRPVHTPFDYETNPNLREDLREQEIQSLAEILRKSNITVNTLHRIECYDISNIQGTHAVASLVVFTNGEKDSSQYRRFKMKTKGPNDFAMMQEVLYRRLKHKEWKLPDLIIVDGGKGQISSARKILGEKQLFIPLIGLAKREEIIITSDFKEIILPKSAKALQLMMRIRDEAHRFAITYHRKLRSKFLLKKF